MTARKPTPKKPKVTIPPPRKPKERYAAGWMPCPEPEEDLMHFTRHTWVDYYIAVKSHRLFKHIVMKNEWEQFTILPQNRKDVLL